MDALLIVQPVPPAPLRRRDLVGSARPGGVAALGIFGQALVLLRRPLDLLRRLPFVLDADLAKLPMRGRVVGRSVERLLQEGLSPGIVAREFFSSAACTSPDAPVSGDAAFGTGSAAAPRQIRMSDTASE